MKRLHQHHNPLIPFHPSPSTLVHRSPPCYFTSLFALSLLAPYILDVTLNEALGFEGERVRTAHVIQITPVLLSMVHKTIVSALPTLASGCSKNFSRPLIFQAKRP